MGSTPGRVSVPWHHPWIRIDRALRAILAGRLECGPSDKVDRALAQVIAEREKIEQAGWFNEPCLLAGPLTRSPRLRYRSAVLPVSAGRHWWALRRCSSS
jgi:hypothetical protein